jgi:hypothetical protein
MNLSGISGRSCVTFALVLFIAAGAHAQVAATTTTEHLAAMTRMLHATKAGELFAHGMREAIKKRHQTEKTDLDRLVIDVLSKMTPAAAVDRLAPIYARYLSQAEAIAVANFFESAAGRKFMNKLLAEKTGMHELHDTRYTAADIAAISLFEKTAGAQAWVEASDKSAPEIKKSMADWGKDLMAARLASDPAANSLALGASQPARHFVGIVQKYMARSALEEKKFGESIEKFEGQAVLSPANLVSAEKLAEGNRAVADMEKTIEDYLAALEVIQKDMYVEIAAIEFKAEDREEFVKGFEKGLARGLSLRLRFAETQRTGISLFRRMLQFAGSRLGSIRLDGDNKLVFERDADLETYRSLVAQFRQITTEEEKISNEAQNARERANALLAGIPGTPPPPSPPVQTQSDANSTKVTTDSPSQSGVRQRYVTARTAGPVFSGYVTRLLDQLKKYAIAERSGSLQGTTRQETVLTISILSSGYVSKVTVNHSSGDKSLDDALVNLVRRNAPFGAFSDDMKKETDLLLVTGAL